MHETPGPAAGQGGQASQPAAGWYDDPGGQPYTERYWDGGGWTGATRQPVQAAPVPPPPGPPAGPVGPWARSAPPGGRRILLWLGAGVAAFAVLAALLANAMRPDDPGQQPGPAPTAPTAQRPSDPATRDPAGRDRLIDPRLGVSYPLPPGWAPGVTGGSTVSMRTGEHVCRDGRRGCVHGYASSSTAIGTDPAQVAKEFGGGLSERAFPSGARQSTVLSQGPVVLDGHRGYQTRWQVTPNDPAASSGGVTHIVVFELPGKENRVGYLFFSLDSGVPGSPDPDLIEHVVSGLRFDAAS